MEYVVSMILWISCGVTALMAILSVWGLYLKRVGQLPFDEDMLQSQGGSYVLASDG